jgi:ribonuclease P protein component
LLEKEAAPFFAVAPAKLMAIQTFGKDRRVRRPAEYKRAFQGGSRVHGRYFTFVTSPNGRAIVRLGIVASRKLGDAVARNRAKRLIREIFRQSELMPGAGVDLVVIPRDSVFNAPYATLEADFRDVLRRALSRSHHAR